MREPDIYDWCPVPPYLLPLFAGEEGWSEAGHYFVRRWPGWRREQRLVLTLSHDELGLMVTVELDRHGRERDHATLTFPNGVSLLIMNAETELSDVICQPPRDPAEAHRRFHSIRTLP